MVDSSRNVGIGTTGPGAKLDVAGTALVGTVRTIDADVTSAAGTPLSIVVAGNNDDAYGIVNIGASAESSGAVFGGLKTRSTGTDANTIVVDGDGITRWIGRAADGAAFSAAAQIIMAVDGTPGLGDMPGRIVFATSADGTTNLAERMRITSAGNVGIGTTGPGGLLTVSSDSSSPVGNTRLVNLHTENNSNTTVVSVLMGADGTSGAARFVTFRAGATTDANGTEIGTIAANNNAVAYNTTSDARLKENIIPTVLGLDTLRQIEVRDYNFISDPGKVVRQGFIAQELYTVYPEAVGVGGDDLSTQVWSVEYGRLTPLLVKSVQELNLKIEGPENDFSLSSLFVDILQALVEKFADAANGIEKFFAKIIHSDTIYTKTICVGNPGSETCITQDQLNQLLSNSLGSVTISSGGTQDTPTTDTSVSGQANEETATTTEEVTEEEEETEEIIEESVEEVVGESQPSDSAEATSDMSDEPPPSPDSSAQGSGSPTEATEGQSTAGTAGSTQ